MVMHSIQLSALQWRRVRSTFNAHSVAESVMSAAKVVRRNAVRLAWVMVTFAPMVMLYNASRADESVATQRVSYKDLNLNNPEDAAVLYGRIKKAANRVCENWDQFHLPQLYALQACVDGAVSRGVADVNSPMLTSLYREKTGKADKKIISLAQSR
jgi:UrcA family protein